MTPSRTPRLPGWLLALVLLLPAVVGSAPASAEDGRCGDVTVVFARGSGQRLAQRESAVFFAGLSVRLGPAVRATAYELGAATYGGARYPAVGVGVDSSDAFENLLDAGAYWTGNAGGGYRASVASGATELRTYLEQRLRDCPEERVVLGGYSQGAQVVGDALPALPRRLRDRIVFVALFGDPKLSLPEGRGVFPVACRGRSLSPWRRGNASCYTDNGVLDARSPYVPLELARRVGSWCDRDDPICTSNLGDFARSTHGTYAKPGRAVDQAVREAAAAVRDALGERGEGIDVTVGTGAPASVAAVPWPAVALVVDEYWTRPGEPVTFDASASALPPSAVAAYRWDFDGDGTTDRTTSGPSVDHVYPATFEGRARLRVGAADGAELMTSVAVHVDRSGLTRRLPAGPTAVTVRAAYGADGAVVRWRVPRGTAADGAVDAWRIHDADGRLLAHVPASARQAELATLPDRSTALLVEAVNEYGTSASELAAPRGTGSSRFAAVVPARNVTGPRKGNPKRPAEQVRASAAGAEEHLTTAPLVIAVALLLATTGAHWIWLFRALPTARGRHRRR
ncbi:cutinase family protein [Cryptosporangium minutisporangium]|uniref:PKD domain-containing protein n=1 Tax=Cryptosporangium minutisporangium TaxID=113569 RepID=A0ABP6SUS4_9ACTN